MTRRTPSIRSAVAEIRARWQPVALAAAWEAIPAARRSRVLAELEELAREVGDSDPVLASDLAVALDALDTIAASASVLGAHPAAADIEKLLGLLESAERVDKP